MEGGEVVFSIKVWCLVLAWENLLVLSIGASLAAQKQQF